MNTDLVVQVRARTVPQRTYIAQDVAAMDILSRNHGESGKMGIQGFDAMAVVDDDFASVSVTEAGLNDGSIRRTRTASPLLVAMSMPVWNAPSPLNGSRRAPEELVTTPCTGHCDGASATSTSPLKAAGNRRREVEPVRDLSRHRRGA